eukprot:5451227-Pleurochrysis_carterae.AAC.1
MILGCGAIEDVHATFSRFAASIRARCPYDDPSRKKIVAAAERVMALTAPAAAAQRNRDAIKEFIYLFVGAVVASAGIAWLFA